MNINKEIQLRSIVSGNYGLLKKYLPKRIFGLISQRDIRHLITIDEDDLSKYLDDSAIEKFRLKFMPADGVYFIEKAEGFDIYAVDRGSKEELARVADRAELIAFFSKLIMDQLGK